MPEVDEASPIPTLSVIVPIFDVERYLDACLRSIAEQSLTDLEVIMVDDGSKDASASIAEAWEKRDDRFTLLTQENRGPGCARNRGIDRARGKYLAFMDSDDIVLQDAYRRMVGVLEETGSDFAVGGLEQYDGRSHWKIDKYHQTVQSDARRQHISASPELLHDTLVPNKVWRSSFVNRHGIRFPEWNYYEDIPTLIYAHFIADHVDLVSEPMFYWRIRESGDSITQDLSTDIRKFTDRAAGIGKNLELFSRHHSQRLHAEYTRHVLRWDFRYYLNIFDKLGERYREAVHETVRAIVGPDAKTLLEDLGFTDRIKYELLLNGDLSSLAVYARLCRERRLDEIPAVARDGRAELDLASRIDIGPGFDTGILECTDQLRLVSSVSDLRIETGALVIEGTAHTSRLTGIDRRQEQVQVWLEDGDSRIDARVEPRTDPGAAARAGIGIVGAEHTGFTATIPISSIHRRGRGSSRNWTVMGSATCGGLRTSGPLKPSTSIRPLLRRLSGSTWLRASSAHKGTLTVRLRDEFVVATRASIDDDAVELCLWTSPGFSGELLLVLPGIEETTCEVPITRRRPFARTGIARIPTSMLRRAVDESDRSDERSWRVYAWSKTRNSSRRVDATEDFQAARRIAGDREWFPLRTGPGVLRIVDQPTRPLLRRADWGADASLSLDIEYPRAGSVSEVVLRSEAADVAHLFPVEPTARGCRARMDLGAMAAFGRTQPIRAGIWDLCLREDDEEIPVGVADGTSGWLPVETRHRSRGYAVVGRRFRSAAVLVESDLDEYERGRANQHRLRTVAYPAAKGRLRDAILYEDYQGRHFSDSPRGIFEELTARGADLEHLVVSDDQQVTVPDGAVPIRRNGREYYDAMAQCRFIIASTHLPAWFEKADDQTVVQTWHGTPLKRIGFDVNSKDYINPHYRASIAREAPMWDYVVSASDYTSPIMRSAFGYHGPLLETGLPRNDRFFGPDAEACYRNVRDRLGIPQDRKILLYAPTWRDRRQSSGEGLDLELEVDLRKLADRVGDEYTVLFRKHAMSRGQLPMEYRGAALDASAYHDVQDLLVATDLLVTDYSSLMFDFANTGRPMVFYTYDLERYRDEIRGFYFDFESVAPGPLVPTEDELTAAISGIDLIRERYDDRYREFRSKFCTWDDGKAAAEVADAVFGAV